MINKKLLMDTDTWYIQDGLELHLDGIYNDSYINQTHVDNPSIWKDLSGKGNDFKMTNTTTTQDSFIFNGNARGINNFNLGDTELNSLLSGVKNRTIEIVCKLDNNASQTIFLGIGDANVSTGGAGFWYKKGDSSMKPSTATNYYNYQATNILERNSYCATYNSAHYTATNFYENGTSATRLTPNDCMNNRTYIMIGARYFNSVYGYALKGEICAIRVYNRILTTEERAHNLALDMRRFGISANGAVIDE